MRCRSVMVRPGLLLGGLQTKTEQTEPMEAHLNESSLPYDLMLN